MPPAQSTKERAQVMQKRAAYNIITMQNNLRYINLSWAVVAICEDGTLPLSTIVHDEQDEAEVVERYVIGYMAFWHIAFAVVVGTF